MFKSYLFVMRMLRRPQPSLAEAVPALFESMLSLFAPRRFVFAVDHGELRYLTRGERGHWNGEEITGESLTECPPGEARDLIDELRETLAAAQPTQLWVGAEGALYHHAPNTPAPSWYGRWRLQRSLSELIEPSFSWTDDEQAIEVRLPISGYPLTSIKLRGRPEGDRVIDDGDHAAAAANRALLADAFARMPAALGLARDDVSWELHGDTNVLAARYPTDAACVRELLHQL